MDVSTTALFVFIIPGFFSLKLLGKSYKSTFEHFVMSMFAGLMVLFITMFILEIIPFTVTIENDYELGIPLSAVMGLTYIIVCYLKKTEEYKAFCKWFRSKKNASHKSKKRNIS